MDDPVPHPRAGLTGHAGALDAYRYAQTTCELSTVHLWMAYLTMGGFFSLAAFSDGLRGVAPFPAREHDRLAAALNDELIEHRQRYRIPYTEA